jgi:hypothetical protein
MRQPPSYQIRRYDTLPNISSLRDLKSMDPRHTLYRTFEKLQVDPEAKMSARTDQEAAQVQATSGVTPESIEKKLKESLGAVYVEIADLSGMSIPSVCLCLFEFLLCFASFCYSFAFLRPRSHVMSGRPATSAFVLLVELEHANVKLL